MFSDITYKGKSYICRIVKGIDDEDVIIAGLSLLEAMPSDISTDREARTVDEEIIFYVSDSDLGLSDNELIEMLKQSITDFNNL